MPEEHPQHLTLGSAITAVLMSAAIALACQYLGTATNHLLAPPTPTATEKSVFFLLLGLAVLGVDFLLYELSFGRVFSRLAVQLNVLNGVLSVSLVAIIGDAGFTASPGSLIVVGSLGMALSAFYFLNWVVLLRTRLPALVRLVKGIANSLIFGVSAVLAFLAGSSPGPEHLLWSVVQVFGIVVAAYTLFGWFYIFGPPRRGQNQAHSSP
jgi:hypothetical protein